MIHIKNLSLSFGSQTVFDGISCNIDQTVRMGLVGRNGSGKSTLLKVIANQQAIDSGSVAILPSKRIAYMPQEMVLQSDKSIIDETLSACGDLHALKQELLRLEHEIEQGNTDDHIINRYVALQEQYIHLEPDKLQAEAGRILLGLGFKHEQLHQPVSSLSVGWKMRIVLAQLLLQKADFYLFDEPTNHLDIVAKDWFLRFLKTTAAGYLLVCHERYFLDKLCTSILALENGKAKVYKGNYSAYEKQYAHDLEQLQAAYIQQKKDIKQKKATIERFRASATKAKMVQSMIKKLDKMERITLPLSIKNVSFQFPEPKHTGRLVLKAEDIAHTFDSNPLFKKVNMEIERGQRVALVAANGVGKTTLFNLLVSSLSLQNGSITFGSNVEYAIFAQDQNESLDLDSSIFKNAKDRCSQKTEQQIRSILGSFLFSADDVNKKVRVLSGGERNRVAMAIILMQDANFLLLDEPTNHLDMQSKELLVKALKSYGGTLLFVSHDHYFINQLATRIVELTPYGAYSYQGNYDMYLHQKQEREQQVETPLQRKKKTSGKKQHEQNKETHKLEHKINKLEQQIKQLEYAFADLQFGTDAFVNAQQQLQEKKSKLDELFAQWALRQAQNDSSTSPT